VDLRLTTDVLMRVRDAEPDEDMDAHRWRAGAASAAEIVKAGN